VVIGITATNYATVAEPGTVVGFPGKIQLGVGRGPENAPLAGVVAFRQLPPSTKPTLAEQLMTPPGVWFVAFGSAILFCAFILNMRWRGSYFMTNKNSRNAFLDAVSEIKERLEKIEESQTTLVKKPPVLRSFDAQIKKFDERLATLETASAENRESLSKNEQNLASMSAQYSKLAAASEQFKRDNGVMEGAVKQVEHGVNTATAALVSKLEQVAQRQTAVESSLNALSELSKRVKELSDEMSATNSRVESAGQQAANYDASSEQRARRIEAAFKELGEEQSQVRGMQSAFENRLASLAALIEKQETALGALASGLQQLEVSLTSRLEGKEFRGQLETALSKIGDQLSTVKDAQATLVTGEIKDLAKKFEAVQASLKEVQRAQSAAPNLAQLVSAVEAKGNTKSSKESGDIRFQALAADLAAMRKDVDSRLERIIEPLSGLSNLKADVEARVDSLAQPLVGISKTRDEMEQRIQALSSAVDELLRRSDEPPKVVYVPVDQSTLTTTPLNEQISTPLPQQELTTPVGNEVNERGAAAGAAPSPSAPEVAAPEAAQAPPPEVEEVEEKSPEVRSWSSSGGSSERHWSANVGSGLSLLKSEKPMRPLTPVDTPAAKYSVGGAVYLDGRIAYAHGDAIRAFWPGKDESAVTLFGPMPHEDWRFLVNKRLAYCVQEDRVEIINLTGWSTQHVFNGKYIAQAYGANWVGLLTFEDHMHVDMRDASGHQLGKPRKTKIRATEKALIAASGQIAWVLSESGHLTRADETKAEAFATVDDKKDVVCSALCVYKNNPVIVFSCSEGVWVRIYDAKKGTYKEVDLPFSGVSTNPVILGDRMYVAASDANSVFALNLKKMQVHDEIVVSDAKQVRKMIGMISGSEHYLAMATVDMPNKAGRALVYDVASGNSLILCPVDQPHVDLLPADNKIVVITSTSYQNIVRVFAPFITNQRAVA
jgi:hypothetical protein